jgi:hypothetical protein
MMSSRVFAQTNGAAHPLHSAVDRCSTREVSDVSLSDCCACEAGKFSANRNAALRRVFCGYFSLIANAGRTQQGIVNHSRHLLAFRPPVSFLRDSAPTGRGISE